MSLITPAQTLSPDAELPAVKAPHLRIKQAAFVDSAFWEKLTWLRGILALYVVFHHTRNEMWPNLRDIPSVGPWYAWNAFLMMISLYGLHAVFLFFIVSGLSIHAATLSRSGSGFQVEDFYRRRLRRLMPALLASMVATAIIFAVFQHGDLRTQGWALLATLTFQQDVLAPNFGGNAPYWSLAHEAYYYLLYPALLLVARKLGGTRALAVFTVASLMLWSVLPMGGRLAAYYPVWLAGFWLAELLSKDQSIPLWMVVSSLGVVLISLGTTIFQRTHPLLAHPLWLAVYGVALTAVVYLWLTQLELEKMPPALRRPMNLLGEMSYSLYLCHYPVIGGLGATFPLAKQHFFSAAMPSVTAVLVSLTLGWLIYHFVERPLLLQRRA